MKRKHRIILAVLIIVIGSILNGFAWSTDIGHPISTISLISGLGMIFGGIILLILSLDKKAHTHNNG